MRTDIHKCEITISREYQHPRPPIRCKSWGKQTDICLGSGISEHPVVDRTDLAGEPGQGRIASKAVVLPRFGKSDPGGCDDTLETWIRREFDEDVPAYVTRMMARIAEAVIF